MEFKHWLEQSERLDDIEQTILSRLGEDMSFRNRKGLLDRNLADLSDPDSLRDVQTLGIVSNIQDDDPNRYNDILNDIENRNGTVRDLITKIKGDETNAPLARIAPDVHNNQVGTPILNKSDY